jgi:hypothetical protein
MVYSNNEAEGIIATTLGKDINGNLPRKGRSLFEWSPMKLKAARPGNEESGLRAATARASDNASIPL